MRADDETGSGSGSGWTIRDSKHICKNAEPFKDAYAYEPRSGEPDGGSKKGSKISVEDAQISVAWCADKLKGECSQKFLSVSERTGQCYCVDKDDDCTNTKSGGYTFEYEGL